MCRILRKRRTMWNVGGFWGGRRKKQRGQVGWGDRSIQADTEHSSRTTECATSRQLQQFDLHWQIKFWYVSTNIKQPALRQDENLWLSCFQMEYNVVGLGWSQRELDSLVFAHWVHKSWLNQTLFIIITGLLLIWAHLIRQRYPALYAIIDMGIKCWTCFWVILGVHKATTYTPLNQWGLGFVVKPRGKCESVESEQSPCTRSA